MSTDIYVVPDRIEFDLTVELVNVDPELLAVLTCQLDHAHTLSECVGSNIVLGDN